jgi:hypothetical protein
VALRAGDTDVLSGERKLCECVVIELCTSPTRGGVARSAFARKSGGDVIRIRRGVVFLGVAGIAGCARALVLAADVTALAGETSVGSSQSKAGDLRVVKFRATPSVK